MFTEYRLDEYEYVLVNFGKWSCIETYTVLKTVYLFTKTCLIHTVNLYKIETSSLVR